MNLDRIRATLADNPLALFSPSPALRDFMGSKGKRILVRAANRTGKTRHAAAKLAALMLATPHGRFRAVGVTYQQSISVVSRYLHSFLPPTALATGCRFSLENGWTHQLIRLKNGSTCEIRSQDQSAISHAGSDLDGVWIDEVPPPDVFLECVKRVVSRGGWVWCTFTPIGRPSKWFRRMVEEPGSPWEQVVVEFSQRNCPWYTHVQVTAWLAEAAASPWAYRQTIFGDWEGEVLDRTFTGFDEGCIVDDDQLPVEEPFRLGIGIDHGEGIGRQVALLCLWTDSTFIVLDEIVNTTTTLPEADARAIVTRLQDWGWALTDVARIVGDINSAGKMGAGMKVNEVLGDALAAAAGLRARTITITAPDKGKGSVELGSKLVNAAFMRGTLKVHRGCVGLITSLKNYAPGPKGEDLKHPLDALRYISQPVLHAWSMTLPSISRLRVR
jgi:phage terminase large subunit-like protein